MFSQKGSKKWKPKSFTSTSRLISSTAKTLVFKNLTLIVNGTQINKLSSATTTTEYATTVTTMSSSTTNTTTSTTSTTKDSGNK